jgi:nucleotide-binding universal stress UspA family protein
MKCIMVATDGSESACRAIDYAALQAKESGAELLIVNVIGGYGLPGKLLEQFTGAQHAWLKEMLAGLSSTTLAEARDRARRVSPAAIQLESREGEVAATLLEIAHERHAELLVVGKRGAGRAAGLLLGSISQKLVSLAPVPVTVVP